MKSRASAPDRLGCSLKCLLSAVIICMLFWFLPSPAPGDQSYLTATFDDKTVDQPIGTGGASVGEPVAVQEQAEAIVRSEPFETPCLEFRNVSAAGNVFFELDNPVTEGIVAVIIDLWFYEDSGCNYWLDLYNSSWYNLTKIGFDYDHTFYINDPAGYAVTDVPHAFGRPLPILMVFNLDAGTYSVWIDEVQQVNERALSVALYDFKHLVVGSGWDCSGANRLSIDQIRIIDHEPQVPVEVPTWGSLRALFR